LAIIELLGDSRVGCSQRTEVVCDPADGAAAERVEATKKSLAPDALHRFAGRATAHGQDDGAVFQRRRQATNQRDHASAPGGEEPRLVADGANDEGGRAGVAGVDDASQRQIVQQERVRLIHDEGGGELLDGPVEGGRRDVGGGERSLGQRGRQVFSGRLAAPLEG